MNIKQIEQALHADFNRGLDMLQRMIRNEPDLSDQVQHELDHADIDLEIDLREGRFFPKGARLLDDRLINDPLDWLHINDLDTVREPLTKALEHLLRARQDERLLSDAVTDAYDALEAMAKIVCDNNRSFDGNREQFINRIGASDAFRRIAREIASYAHAFRHGASATQPKPTLTEADVETFIYSVGILIRMAMHSM